MEDFNNNDFSFQTSSSSSEPNNSKSNHSNESKSNEQLAPKKTLWQWIKNLFNRNNLNHIMERFAVDIYGEKDPVEQFKESEIGRYIENRFKWTALDLIGMGGFAQVFLMQESKNKKKTFAMKLIDCRKRDIDKSLLKLELKISCKLSHEFIIKTYKEKSFIYNDFMVITQMAAEGDLRSMIILDIDLDNDRIRLFMSQLCLALKYLHEKAKVAHLDIKPDNILVMSEERNIIKLTDFGLCQPLFDKKTKKKNLLRDYVGTLHYMSPEQIEASEKNPAELVPIDMYQFGVTIFETIAKRLPIPVAHVRKADFYEQQVRLRKLALENNFWNKRVLDQDDDFKQLMFALLNPDPEQRPGAREIEKHAWFSKNQN